VKTGTLPNLIKVNDFGELFGLTRSQSYDALRQLPPGVKVTLGRRVRVDLDRLREWLAQGGSIAK
jgi:hypothetical protein